MWSVHYTRPCEGTFHFDEKDSEIPTALWYELVNSTNTTIVFNQ